MFWAKSEVQSKFNSIKIQFNQNSIQSKFNSCSVFTIQRCVDADGYIKDAKILCLVSTCESHVRARPSHINHAMTKPQT